MSIQGLKPKSVLSLTLIWLIAGPAIAQSIPPAPTQIAQTLMGQCRAAKRAIFLYADRSLNNPLEALELNARVTLEEEDKNNGWIAARSLTTNRTGFVRTSDIKPCADAPPMAVAPSQPRPPKPLPNTHSSTNLCRLVLYDDPQGIAVRDNPNLNANRVGGVIFEQRVLLEPARTHIDAEGREWVKLREPVVGWMSNGFPEYAGDRNLGACP
jgi:hypothetical protein